MFKSSEAVHFVSASLDSAESGRPPDVLRGDVRGWQGERTLAADEVEMIQEGEVLNARGRVATRMPRERPRARRDRTPTTSRSARTGWTTAAARTARSTGAT